MKPKITQLNSLVEQISHLQKQGIEVVLVSSGAVVLGMGELGLTKRSNELSFIQATAALGQATLMKTYNELFAQYDRKCGQVLLTWDDFRNRERYINARNTFQAMMDWKIVPIVNENDTISTDEIKFGDNDKLSALVACLVEADLLVILSDVEGLYDLSGSEKKVFEEIKEVTREIEGLASGTTKKHMSKGGMTAKLEAVKMVSKAKIPCIIAHGETENVLKRILDGETIGTFFVEREEKLLARKHWISFGAKAKGVLTIDEGAKKALVEGGKSLLLPGVISWEGHFNKEDVVVVCDKHGVELARGVTNYSTAELEKMSDRKGKLEAIHRDNLVLAER